MAGQADPTQGERVLLLAEEMGVVRPRDLEARGISRNAAQTLARQGVLVREARGLYALPNADTTEHHSLAAVAARVPQGVVCLLSALRFHDLTMQNPHQVWLAIDPKAHRPRLDNPPVRIVRFSGAALTEGIDDRVLEGVMVRITNVPKTVADCFKYRNKIGLDVALEALRDAWRSHATTMDELWHYAGICRVANVMRPYLESVT